ncbi:hypothetical protein QK900_11255 [Arsenicicoccus dermatophilus]|uniref:hypothetical protein n=1 Tax=Arsenicicoccus dermatophilus TaxID=1076331 RepID=UPI003892A897
MMKTLAAVAATGAALIACATPTASAAPVTTTAVVTVTTCDELTGACEQTPDHWRYNTNSQDPTYGGTPCF